MKRRNMVTKWMVVWGMLLICGMLIACKNEQPTATQEENWKDSSEESVAYEEVKTEEEETIEETQEEWVPEEFERYTVEGPLFVAPAVHTEAKEQCTFLWTVMEDDMLEWYKEKYATYDDYASISVSNRSGSHSHIRSYYVSGVDDAQGSRVSMEVETGGYSEKYAHRVSVHLTSDDLQQVVADMTEFIEMMNLGEYAETILHSDSTLTIETENGLGYYMISSSYFSSGEYNLNLGITYSDSSYDTAYVPEKMEYWQDEYSLSDFIINSEFDTSSFEALETDILKFHQENFDSAYANTGVYTQTFSYEQEDFDGPKKNVEFTHEIEYDGRNWYSGFNGVSFKYNEADKDMSLYISCNFDYDTKYAVAGVNLSDEQIKRLSEVRYKLLKKIDTKTECTLDDMIKLYREAEFGEEYDKYEFESSDRAYWISNDFDFLKYSYND